MSENLSNYNCGSGTLNLCGYLFMVYLLNVGYYETMSFFNNNYSNVNDDDKNKMLFLCGVILFFSLCMLPIAYSILNKDKLIGIPILIIYATMIALIYNIGSTIFNFIIIKNNKEITPFQQNMIEVSISLFFATIILLLLVTLKINDYVIDDRDMDVYLKFKHSLYLKEQNALKDYLSLYGNKADIVD